jgi:TonB-linked SusC/RagA family outer membrane protein
VKIINQKIIEMNKFNNNLLSKIIALKRYILIMKFTLLFLFLSLFQLSANYSQKSMLRFSMQDATIKEVLAEIEQQSNYTFLFDNTKIDVLHKVDVDFENSDIEEVLNELFYNTEINYKIVKNQILLDNKFQNQEFQPIKVTGIVMDEDANEPLPGVNIYIKGTTIGTITDASGNYEIEVPNENATLVFKYIGYKTQEIPVAGNAEINVSLVFEAEYLDEIVVIGYGVVKKIDLTGALATLKEEDFNRGLGSTPEQMIQGKVAGVRIISNNGEPGAGSNIQIRGMSSISTGQQPLFVVDGIPLDIQSTVPNSMISGGWAAGAATSPLNFINPDDIESIDILKDASATAIYGSRGANGVIIITTKKGATGEANINYSAYYSISKIPHTIDVLTADEFIDARVEVLNLSEDDVNHYGYSTNWQDEIFRTAYSHNHNLSISGGTDKSSFHASFNYLDQEGIINKSDHNRITGRINVSQKALNDRFNVDAKITASQVKENRLPIGETTTADGDLIIQAIQANPTMPVYDTVTGEPYQVPGIINPVALLDYIDDETKTNKILASISPSLEIINGLTYKLNLGLEHSASVRRNDQYSAYIIPTNGATGAIAEKDITNYIVENTLSYSRKIGNNHNINLLAGHSYQYFFTEGQGIYASEVQSDDLIRPTYNIETSPSADKEVWAYALKNEMQSFFGRINYDLMEKYLFTATIRRDGSSKFGENNKYGDFPSFAFAWRLSQEDFIRNLNIFDNLKLRIGWGKTGNQEIGSKHSLFALSATIDSRAYLNGGLGNPITNGIVLTKTPNPDIAWETTVSTNTGIDFGLFHGKLYGSVDYFHKKTMDMLLDIPAKQPAPTERQLVNVDKGYVLNKGIELELHSVILSGEELFWEVTGTFTKINNIVEDLPVTLIQTGRGSGQGMSSKTVQVITSGEPMNTFYGYKFLGFDSTGMGIYQEGGSGSDTLVFLGSPHPDFIWGLSSSFTYKNFDFSLFFEGVQGNLIYNNTANSIGIMGNLRQSKNTFPETVNSGENPRNPIRFSNRFIEDGSYLRLSNVTLGYSVPFGKFTLIDNLRFYVTASNLFVITDYSGYDPDINTDASVNGVNSIGIDNSCYPKPRTFLFGMSITF